MSAKVRNSAKAGIIIVGLMAFIGLASGTSYYVDYGGGSDSNSGTGSSSPWKHCPGDPSATGTPASATLRGGDTVFFKAGTTYVLTAKYTSAPCAIGIAVNWSGTASQPITYDGMTWGDPGARATLTDNCTTNIMDAFYTPGNMTGVTFYGFEIGPIGGSATLPADPGSALPPSSGGGIASGGPMSNVTINNCFFHNLGYWFNQKPMGANTILGGAFECKGCANLTITNCEFTKMMVGLELQTSTLMTNLVVADCNFHNYIVWCIDLAHTANGCLVDHIYIHDNTFHDFDRDYGGANTGGPWTGYGDPPHQDGVFSRADNLSNFTDGTDINIYNNSFYDTFNWPGGTSCIFLVGSVSANIYNNVFSLTPEPNAALTMNIGYPTNYLVRILNNTFYENGSTSMYIGGYSSGGTDIWPPTPNSVMIKNNVFYDMLQNASYNYTVVFDASNISATNGFNFDYNNYTSFNLNSAFGLWAAGLGYLRLGVMHTAGWEAHGTSGNPGFNDISHGINGTLNDLHLKTTGPGATAGLNLTSLNLPGLASDKDGYSRPATGAWSVGAYQAGNTGNGTTSVPPTGQAPPAPQGLHIVSPKN